MQLSDGFQNRTYSLCLCFGRDDGQGEGYHGRDPSILTAQTNTVRGKAHNW